METVHDKEVLRNIGYLQEDINRATRRKQNEKQAYLSHIGGSSNKIGSFRPSYIAKRIIMQTLLKRTKKLVNRKAFHRNWAY